MDALFLIFLVLTGIGSLLGYFLKRWIAGKLGSGFGFPGGPFGGGPDIEAILRQMENLVRIQSQSMPGSEVGTRAQAHPRRASKADRKSAEKVDLQLLALQMKLKNGLRQIDDFHRQQYMDRVGEIQSQAAQAGLTINTPSWN